MKRTLNTIPLSKRKYFMTNFFLPRLPGKKQVVSKTPFVGYERAYQTMPSNTNNTSSNNTNNTNIDSSCCNELAVTATDTTTTTTITTANAAAESEPVATSLSLPASVSNPFAMFKNPSAGGSASKEGGKLSTQTPLQTVEPYKLAFDGCSKGNPGRAGAGAVIYEGAKEVWADARYVGDRETNNVAEYTGLIMGLHEALRRGITRLLVQGDSELIIKQMKGEYAVKSENIRSYYETAKGLAQQFKWVEFRHVYRAHNKRADELSNEGLNANTNTKPIESK
jgi:ribonuclease HI